MTDTEYQQLYDLLKQAIHELTEADAQVEWYVLCAAQRITHAKMLKARYPNAASVA